MQKRLDGRVVLITGGCGDIGRAAARACLSEGAAVVVSDIVPAASCTPPRSENGDAALYLPCDVRDRPAVSELVADVVRRMGRLDVVIANAGLTRSSPALDVSVADWQELIDINLTGAFHVAQEGALAMRAAGWPGVLLFTGSWAGEVPSRGLLPYCVSKAGMQMLARCLALELAPHGIRANVVAPGVLDAGLSAQIFRQFPERRQPFERIIPLGTLGTAEQVADAMVFLASDAASYITGATLLVDGGASLFQFAV